MTNTSGVATTSGGLLRGNRGDVGQSMHIARADEELLLALPKAITMQS